MAVEDGRVCLEGLLDLLGEIFSPPELIHTVPLPSIVMWPSPAHFAEVARHGVAPAVGRGDERGGGLDGILEVAQGMLPPLTELADRLLALGDQVQILVQHDDIRTGQHGGAAGVATWPFWA